MPTSGAPRRAGIDANDVPEIAALFDAGPPYVSVYVGTEPDVPQASQRTELRWAAVRRELADAGAPPPALDAIDPVAADAHRYGLAFGAIANAGGLLLVRHGDQPVDRDVGRLGPLPATAPLLVWEQSRMAHLLVVADHAGADVLVFGRAHDRRVVAGDGRHDDPHLFRNQQGGWSQRRFQQRAENRWEADAKEVAAAVARAFDESGARFVALAGDVRARQLVMEALPDRVRAETYDLEKEHGLNPDDDPADATIRLLDTIVASDTVAVVEKLKEEVGQEDRGVRGVGPTLAALAAAQVDLLLVQADPDDTRTVWIGEAPHLVAPDAASVEAMGSQRPAEARLADAAIRAAFGTGAAVRIVPGVAALPEGIGALLRSPAYVADT